MAKSSFVLLSKFLCIQDSGGVVVLTSVLATIYGGINFFPKKRTIQILRAKFGLALDKILYCNGIAESAERLSEHQAKYLISKWKDAHSLRRGILNFREKEGQRIFSAPSQPRVSDIDAGVVMISSSADPYQAQ